MKIIQIAWEGLSNAMRLYTESRLRFKELLSVDAEEAINNMDRALEAKLEKFHALYDVTKSLPGFDYFDHGDTALLIHLRNALHHRDHPFFVSWNSHVGPDGTQRLAGTSYLLASTTPETLTTIERFYFPLHDFYSYLESRQENPRFRNVAAARPLWDTDLQFAEIRRQALALDYPSSNVYVDVMPAFISALCRVSQWLKAIDFQPVGFDGDTYFDHFQTFEMPCKLEYKHIKFPFRNI